MSGTRPLGRDVTVTIQLRLPDNLVTDVTAAQAVVRHVARWLQYDEVRYWYWQGTAHVHVERGAYRHQHLPSVEALEAGREAFTVVMDRETSDIMNEEAVRDIVEEVQREEEGLGPRD
jgi:hypothetical protein